MINAHFFSLAAAAVNLTVFGAAALEHYAGTISATKVRGVGVVAHDRRGVMGPANSFPATTKLDWRRWPT